MPTPSPLPGPPLSRRAVLAGLAGVAGAALVGCTSGGDTGTPTPAAHTNTPAESVAPDVALAAEALASQEEVLGLLEATTKRHPPLARDLATVIAAHKAHTGVLERAVPKGVSLSASPTPSGKPRQQAVVPGNQARALAGVVEAEQQLVTAVKRQAFRAESGAFARLLASMAAASAQYATLLRAKTAGSGS